MKLPEKAELKFKGKIFDVYQWEQELFDGSTATFEMLKRPDTLVVIPIVDDKIVYVQDEQPNRPPFLALPGGRQEPDESPLEGIKRELLEETGITSDDWELFRVYEPTSKLDWRIHVFIARSAKVTEEQAIDAGEKIDVRYADFDEFIDMVFDQNFPEKDFALDLFRMKYKKPQEFAAFRERLGV